MTAAPPGPAPSGTRPWWVRPGLEVRDGRLAIAGRDAETLAREGGTPRYVYDLERVAENARNLIGALGRSGVHHRVRFALKANREAEVLAVLRGLGGPGDPRSIGIDACSPGEVLHALAQRLARRRDQLHRHERLGGRPRRPPVLRGSISTWTP